MAPAIVPVFPSAVRHAISITEPSSPPPRPSNNAPPRPRALSPSSDRHVPSPSTAPRAPSPPTAPPSTTAPPPTLPPTLPPPPALPALAGLALPPPGRLLPLPGSSPLPGSIAWYPTTLRSGPPGSPFVCPFLSHEDEARLVAVVRRLPWPLDFGAVAVEMGGQTPAYWWERIAEVRALAPASFQNVVPAVGRSTAGWEEEMKKRLDRQFGR